MGLLHLRHTGWIRIPDCSLFLVTARQTNKRKDQHGYRLMYLPHNALRRDSFHVTVESRLLKITEKEFDVLRSTLPM
jgi:hypothetical protein